MIRKVFVPNFIDEEEGVCPTFVWLLDEESIRRYEDEGFSYDLNWGLDGREILRREQVAHRMNEIKEHVKEIKSLFGQSSYYEGVILMKEQMLGYFAAHLNSILELVEDEDKGTSKEGEK